MSIEKSIAKFISRLQKTRTSLENTSPQSRQCNNFSASVDELDKTAYPKRPRGACCVIGLCFEDTSAQSCSWRITAHGASQGYWFEGQACIGEYMLCNNALENGGKILQQQTEKEEIDYLKSIGCIKS